MDNVPSLLNRQLDKVFECILPTCLRAFNQNGGINMLMIYLILCCRCSLHIIFILLFFSSFAEQGIFNINSVVHEVMCNVEDFQNFHLKQESVFLVFVAYQEEENSCPVFLYIPAAL